MKDNKSASLFQKEQVIDSIKQSFVHGRGLYSYYVLGDALLYR